MSYQYAAEGRSYEDLASGRVLYNQHGTTAFPVRLASELFQRGAERLRRMGAAGPYRLYDPCCGGGYMLTSIGFLHGAHVASLTGSDISPEAVKLAGRNMALLTPAGLAGRMEQLAGMYREYGKESHRDALESAARLQKLLVRSEPPVRICCFEADITRQPPQAVGVAGVDFVLCDVPYGQIASWRTGADSAEGREPAAIAPSDPIERLLQNVTPLLASTAVVAIVSTKEQKVQHPAFRRIEQMKLGKRKLTLLEPVRP